MRKILLATTALIALTGAAQAAESPIQVTLGGYVDFRAALFHESENTSTYNSLHSTPRFSRRGGDFQTEYRLNIAAEGKAANGIQYGSLISLYNGVGVGTDNQGTNTDVRMDQAYVWMSGAFGKVLMGDEHGASDLLVMAPTVGEGQIDGSYAQFTDPATLAAFQPAYVDLTENNTKLTYYTPKVGNANHKVQLGVSYTPNSADQGISVVKYDRHAGYQNQIEAVAQYTGTFSPVSVVLTPTLATGSGDGHKVNTSVVGTTNTSAPVRDYTLWGVGAQAMYAGFTLGGSFVDAGNMGTYVGQNNSQNVWNIGLKYEFDKVAVAASYMDGQGYFNNTFRNDPFPATNTSDAAGSYVEDYEAFGVGASYTWFPGLTTAADAVFFEQSRANISGNDQGHVLMLSQKMTF